MRITLTSYRSSARIPPAVRYSWDLSNLRDPIGQADLKASCADGRDDRVMTWMTGDPKVRAVVDSVALLAATHLRPPQEESAISFAFHDMRGIWISPAVTELVARRLNALDLKPVVVVHEALQVNRV